MNLGPASRDPIREAPAEKLDLPACSDIAKRPRGRERSSGALFRCGLLKIDSHGPPC